MLCEKEQLDTFGTSIIYRLTTDPQKGQNAIP